jgi:hypothetical protein
MDEVEPVQAIITEYLFGFYTSQNMTEQIRLVSKLSKEKGQPRVNCWFLSYGTDFYIDKQNESYVIKDTVRDSVRFAFRSYDHAVDWAIKDPRFSIVDPIPCKMIIGDSFKGFVYAEAYEFKEVAKSKIIIPNWIIKRRDHWLHKELLDFESPVIAIRELKNYMFNSVSDCIKFINQ